MADELKLLKGIPIYVDNIPVYPLTIGEITDYLGMDKYNQYLSAVTVDKERVGISDEPITNFELICSFCFQNIDFVDKPFGDIFLEAMGMFLHNKVYLLFNEINAFLVIEEENVCHIISNYNFDRIVEVIKQQNCMVKLNSEDEFNPADAKAREILEKQKKARELLAKAKKQGDDGEPLTLADLVSILVANGNGITPFNVWDMCFYMFQNQFNRMRMLEEYDINIRSLLAGAKSESIDLKHWMSMIK